MTPGVLVIYVTNLCLGGSIPCWDEFYSVGQYGVISFTTIVLMSVSPDLSKDLIRDTAAEFIIFAKENCQKQTLAVKMHCKMFSITITAFLYVVLT